MTIKKIVMANTATPEWFMIHWPVIMFSCFYEGTQQSIQVVDQNSTKRMVSGTWYLELQGGIES